MDVGKYKEELQSASDDVRELVEKINCNPILIRLAWHDSGTYDAANGTGGANGSIRFEEELAHGANASLSKAMKYLQPIKEKYSTISWADLMQLASAVSIAHAGGPEIDMIYGRIDANEPAKEGNLPDAMPPFAGGRDASAADHLRAVFHRMGFNDQEIVALSGAHTVGRAFKERSGTTDNGYGPSHATKYTNGNHIARFDKCPGIGMAGGRSWTKNWLTFDNSYFTEVRAAVEGGRDSGDDLMWLPTDAILAIDPAFKPHFETYAKSQEKFFKDYALAHKKLSELGSKWVVPGGIKITKKKKNIFGVKQELLIPVALALFFAITIGSAVIIALLRKQ